MRIESIHIWRYRSLYDVVFRPSALSVLVGPNNSGKTNLVDAVDLVSEAYRYGLEIAIGRQGGFENIAHRKMRRTKSPVSFEVVATMDPTELRTEVAIGGIRPRQYVLRVTHRFELAARSQVIAADYQVVSEQFGVDIGSSGIQQPLFRGSRGGAVEVHEPQGISPSVWKSLVFPFEDSRYANVFAASPSTQGSELVVGSRFFNPVLGYFSRTFARTRVYQLVPLEGRRPGVLTPNPDLDRHGANLPAFVRNLKKNARVWPSVMETMRRVIPGLIDIDTTFTPDHRTTLRFHEENVGRPWTSEDVSDGTIQVLALLAALYDPRTPFVMIEEPENAVHPWIVRNFVEACRAVSNKQVVLTTHSPVLLNNLSPQEVLVTWRDHGATKLSPLVDLDPESQTLWSQGTSSTFEILDSGWLPQAVPGGET